MKKAFRLSLLMLAAFALVICSVCASGAEALPVDLDLSVMSGTIVYSQIYNMLCDPQAWLGKIIKMAGYYNYYDDEQNGVVYHACIVPDATACCAQGIEFVWAGEHEWPDDYPEIGMNIVVTGRLELYEDNGTQYLHLVDAELLWDPEQQAQ